MRLCMQLLRTNGYFNTLTLLQVVCGECLLSCFLEEEHKSKTIKRLWCPKSNHFDIGEQMTRELFGIDCLICSEKAAEKFDRICREKPADKIDRIYTACGKFW